MLIVVLFVLAGCSGAGSEFVGTWVNSKNASDRFEIRRDGGNFILTETHKSLWKQGEMETTTLPALLADGTLQVQTGFGAVKLAYIKATDSLARPSMVGPAEYKRSK